MGKGEREEERRVAESKTEMGGGGNSVAVSWSQSAAKDFISELTWDFPVFSPLDLAPSMWHKYFHAAALLPIRSYALDFKASF